MTASRTQASRQPRVVGARGEVLPRWSGWLIAALILIAYAAEAFPGATTTPALGIVAVAVAAATLSTWVTPAAMLLTLLAAFGGAVVPEAAIGYLVVLWMPFVVGARYGLLRAGALVAAVLVAELAGHAVRSTESLAQMAGTVVLEVFALAAAAVVGVFVGQVWRRGSEVETDLRESGDAFRRALSRDLHDTAVHATTTMVMRAHQILMREDLDPQTRRDVQFIVDTGQEATATLRSTLASLREADPATSETSADATWFRARLTGAVARLEEAGFEVRSATEISLVDVPPATLSAMGRILTEVTNNVVRHGLPGSEVSLSVENTGDSLDLMCSNPRRQIPGNGATADGATTEGATTEGSTADSGGDRAPERRSYGLVGVRELAEAAGGSATFLPHGDYWVAGISLPLPETAEQR